MTQDFEGRVVVITGGGTGIGRALAAAFHAEGAKVAIASRDPDRLKKTAGVIAARGGTGAAERLVPLRLDVRLPESAQATAARVAELWGHVDVLINNAGASGQTPVDAPGPEADQKWNDIIGTNLTGCWFVTRAFLPRMPDGGRVINISSVLGKFGVAGYSAYCASKHGVIGLTRALAAELAPRRITVNAICPGWVDTAMAEHGVAESSARLGVTQKEFKAAANARVPLGRFLRPEEVAPLAVYLASDAAAALTGQSINIEGGATTW